MENRPAIYRYPEKVAVITIRSSIPIPVSWKATSLPPRFMTLVKELLICLETILV